ncbi:MAG: ERF family protein [Desulfomicrobium apsheronum]|nr:ERF family protein [Desulfomicrobium apsheronum]
MNKSESIASLAAALAKAQGEMENAGKNSVNPHFKSKYADLAEILNTVRPVLSKHGLAVTQFPAFEGGTAHVETILTHASGEWMSGTCSAPVQKSDPQGVGSALTYLRRYSLVAVCGLAQEDDDANAAAKPKATAQKPAATMPKPEPIKPETITDSQRKTLMALYKNAPRDVRIDDANGLLQAAKPGCKRIESFSELTPAMANYLIGQLEAMQQGAA